MNGEEKGEVLFRKRDSHRETTNQVLDPHNNRGAQGEEKNGI